MGSAVIVVDEVEVDQEVTHVVDNEQAVVREDDEDESGGSSTLLQRDILDLSERLHQLSSTFGIV